MTAKNNDKELEYPINQQLLEEATRCMEEWRVIKDRLARIEEHKSQVSPAVYERVRNDYDGRLKEATDALLTKKEDIDGELTTLYETRTKIESQLEEHRHQLEEIKFRNTLGEYTEDEFQDSATSEQEKITKFETVLNAVDNNIHRYESIFEGEEDLFAPQEAAAPEEEISEIAELPEVPPAPHEAEPMTDESGYVIEEEGPDYFGTSDETGKTSAPAEESSATQKTEIAPKTAEEVEGVGVPRIVIINGENAGAAYPLKGTLSFGRAESSTICLKDAKASRQHAQVQKQGNEFIVIDLNSSNGTYVNGEKIEEHVLTNGDEIQIGDTVFQFQS